MIALGCRIGMALSPAHQQLLMDAEKGLSKPFVSLLNSKLAGTGRNYLKVDVAKAMVEITKGYCFVRIRSDGVIVGDCDNCVKHLGYDCPAVNYIRSECGQLEGGINALDNGVKVLLNRKGKVRSNQKNTSNMCEGGLCARKDLEGKRIPKFQRDMIEHMTTLSEEQAFRACVHLKLDNWCYLSKEAIHVENSSIDRDVCVALLQDFVINPEGFRHKQHVSIKEKAFGKMKAKPSPNNIRS